MYPKLYDSENKLLAVLDNVVRDTATIKRVVNGEFTFSFDALEKELKSGYLNPNNKIIINTQTFDIRYIEEKHNLDVTYSIQCEHVNYRLGDGDENVYTSFEYVGTPIEILAIILEGTEFTIGTIDFHDSVALSVKTEVTKKALIYELAYLVGGEIEYTNNGFGISILNTIGKDNGFQVRFGKNLSGITKIIDNRGGLKTHYQIDIVELKNSNEYIDKQLQALEVIEVGDTIRIIDPVIGIDIVNRVLSIEYNPIFAINTKLEIANVTETIMDQIRQIENQSVKQNKIYNGISISPEEGYVSERSDKKSKTVMNATEGISLYSDIGYGLERNFYVDNAGRIKGKHLDIDGTGTFGGELNITENALTVMNVYKDVAGGVLKIFDIDGKLNVKLGVESGLSANTGGTLILYKDVPYHAIPVDYQRVELGINSVTDSGAINLRDTDTKGRISLEADSIVGPYMGIRNAAENLVTYLTQTDGFIGNKAIATEDWVYENGGGVSATSELDASTDTNGNIKFQNGIIGAAWPTVQDWVSSNYAPAGHMHSTVGILPYTNYQNNIMFDNGFLGASVSWVLANFMRK